MGKQKQYQHSCKPFGYDQNRKYFHLVTRNRKDFFLGYAERLGASVDEWVFEQPLGKLEDLEAALQMAQARPDINVKLVKEEVTLSCADGELEFQFYSQKFGLHKLFSTPDELKKLIADVIRVWDFIHSPD